MHNLSEEIITKGEPNISFTVEGREEGRGYYSTFGRDSDLGIVVIQEAWGLNKSICKTSDTVSQLGFKTVVPDIYKGKVPASFEEAHHLYKGLDWDAALADISGAVAFLKAQGAKKVGVTGFCLGGSLSIAVATRDQNISAIAPFYGVPDLEKYKLENIKVPMLAIFAENDKIQGFSSPADAERLDAAAKAANLNAVVKVLPGVDHAFMNQDSHNYNQEVAGKCLIEISEFFNKYLV